MVFLDEDKEKFMATSVQTEPGTEVAKLDTANFFELSHGTSTISYSASNIAGQPVVTYNGRSFTGDEVRREKTELGTLVTVTLEVIIDGPTDLLTLVVPQVLVRRNQPPVPVSLPVVFHTIKDTIAGPPPGQVHTYDVKIYTGKASFVHT